MKTLRPPFRIQTNQQEQTEETRNGVNLEIRSMEIRPPLNAACLGHPVLAVPWLPCVPWATRLGFAPLVHFVVPSLGFAA